MTRQGCPPNDRGSTDYLPVDLIRAAMASGERHIRVALPIRVRVWDPSDETDLGMGPVPTIKVLTVRRMGAPAPYVGDRFIYTWDVAFADDDTWVSGPVRTDPWPTEWDMARRAANEVLDHLERRGDASSMSALLNLATFMMDTGYGQA